MARWFSSVTTSALRIVISSRSTRIARQLPSAASTRSGVNAEANTGMSACSRSSISRSISCIDDGAAGMTAALRTNRSRARSTALAWSCSDAGCQSIRPISK
nr:hypothetical protein [Lysobacter enzymogenes]